MGKSYSVNGYINATLRRTARTFLVEGVSDKNAMHRLAVELYPSLNENVVIDHAGMIDDPETFGLGNKSKVLAVKNRAKELAAVLPKISTSLATLVDREWDGFTFSERPLSSDWDAPIQDGANYVTLGHSLENYFFEIDCIIAFLKSYYAEHFSAEMTQKISESFQDFLALAACVSLRAKESSCLKKLGGLFNSSLIEHREGRYYLTADFDAPATHRRIQDAGDLRESINSLVDEYREDIVKQPNTKWCLHGHVGSEVLWACVAHCAVPFFPPGMADDIVRLHKAERTRFSQDWLSKAHSVNRYPLEQALAWLGTAQT